MEWRCPSNSERQLAKHLIGIKRKFCERRHSGVTTCLPTVC